MAGKPVGPRELIDTGTHKRYVRRDARGRFAEVVREHASTVVKKGMATAATNALPDSESDRE